MKNNKPYSGQPSEEIEVAGLKRTLPLYQVGGNLWILANESLSFGCDIEFTQTVGREIASRIARYNPEILLVPEAKALGFASYIAQHLNHPEFAIARKSAKFLAEGSVSVSIESITTPGAQTLHLDSWNLAKIRGKRVALFDDVISTGGTIRGLLELVEKADGETSVISTVWLEGESLTESFQAGLPCPLVSLGVLPVYTSEP